MKWILFLALLLNLPSVTLAEEEKGPDTFRNIDATGLAEEATTQKEYLDYYSSAGMMPEAVKAAQEYQRSLGKGGQDSMAQARGAYLRQGTRETDADGNTGKCYKREWPSNQTVEVPCNANPYQQPANSYVGTRYSEDSKELVVKDYAYDGNNPQNRPSFPKSPGK